MRFRPIDEMTTEEIQAELVTINQRLGELKIEETTIHFIVRRLEAWPISTSVQFDVKWEAGSGV